MEETRIENTTIKISTSEQNYSITIKPCDKGRDGHFIRELTKENFYDYLSNTIGWNENRHREEPKFPERYLMFFHKNDRIGFLSLRDQPNCIYLETLQLIQQYRRQGIGTELVKFITDIARKKAKDKIQLRVVKDNPALSLYRRNGFKIIEDQGWCFLLEKVLEIF